MGTQGKGSSGQIVTTCSCEPYDGKHGPLTELVPCGCGSPGCSCCSERIARQRAEQFRVDVKRWGIERLATIAVTRDPSRFPDPDHVINARVAFHLMNEVWQVLGAEYRAQWGERPLWWSYREVHDGKRGGRHDSAVRGTFHLHIYFPSPSPTGRIGPRKLKAIREKGMALSGRTTWGWDRLGVYALSVDDASPYAAKGLRYAAKGVVDDGMLDSVRIDLGSRSRAVCEKDPVVMRRRAQERERRERKAAARAVYLRLRHRLGPDNPQTRKARTVYREFLVPGKSRGPMRTHRERIKHCGESSAALVDGVRGDDGRLQRVFVGGVPVPVGLVHADLMSHLDGRVFRYSDTCVDYRYVRVPVDVLRESLQRLGVATRLRVPGARRSDPGPQLYESCALPGPAAVVDQPACSGLTADDVQPVAPLSGGEKLAGFQGAAMSPLRVHGVACPSWMGSARGVGFTTCSPRLVGGGVASVVRAVQRLAVGKGEVVGGAAVVRTGSSPRRAGTGRTWAAAAPQGPHILVKRGCSVLSSGRWRDGP